MKQINRKKNLLKSTLIVSVGMICTKMVSFLLLPLYTAILSTKEFGIIDFLSTLVSLSLPLITFQIEQAIFRLLIEERNDNNNVKDIISSGVLTVVFQCFFCLVLFFAISPLIKNDYRYFLAINVIAHIFSSILLQIARGLGDNIKYTIGSFIIASCTVILNVMFLVVFKLGVYGMLIGTMMGQIIGTIYLFFSLKVNRYLSLSSYDKKIRKKLWNYSIPLIPNAISWWVFSASDRFIATAILGVDQNGILAASLKFSTVYITLYNIFNLSWTETVSLAIEDEDFDSFFNEVFNKLLNIFLALAICVIASMPFVYPVMINSKFRLGYGLVPISIISSFFNVVVGLISVVYVGKKNTKAIANTSIVSAVINIIVHLSLIKFIGLYAAVISSLISFFIMSIYRIYDIRKNYFKINLNKKTIIISSFVLVFVLVAYYLNNVVLNVFSLFVGIIYAIVINKDSVELILTFLKKKANI